MDTLKLEQLSLFGFGPFTKEVTVNFTEDLNNFVAGNEFGKSSLVAGIEAMLYGLPNSATPQVFGTTKYWNPACQNEFGGSLTFKVKNETFKIERNFALLESKLWKIVNGHKQEMPFALLPDILELPHDYYKAFAALGNNSTFLNLAKITSLITKKYHTQLDALSTSIFDLTQSPKSFGLKLKDTSEPRILERLNDNISSLKNRIDESKMIVAKLATTSEELKEHDKTIDQIKTTLVTIKHELDAIATWQQLKRKSAHQLAQQKTLHTATNETSALVNEIEITEEQLTTKYQAYLNLNNKDRQQLESLGQLANSLNDSKNEYHQVLQNIDDVSSQYEKLVKSLDTKYKAFANKDHIVQDFDHFQRAKQEKAQLEEVINTTKAELSRIKQEFELLPDWSKVNEQATRILPLLQTTCDQTVASFNKVTSYKQHVSKLDSLLGGKYSLFASLDEQQKEIVNNYSSLHKNSLEKMQKAQGNWESAQEQIRSHTTAKKGHAEVFRDLQHIDNNVTGALKEKLDLDKKLQELQVRLAKRKTETKPARIKYVIGILLSLGLGAGVFFSWSAAPSVHRILAAIGVSLVSSGLITTLLRQNSQRDSIVGELEEHILKCSQRIRILDLQLGGLVHLTSDESQAVYDRLQEREISLSNLRAMERSIPNDQELLALKQRQEHAKAAYNEFVETTKQVASAFEKPDMALDEWRQMVSERKHLLHELKNIMSEEFGVNSTTTNLEDIPLSQLSGKWQSLQRLSQAYDVNSKNCQQLINWLETLNSNWWMKAADTAARWETLQNQYTALNNRLAQLIEPDSHGTSRFQRLEATIIKLSKALSPSLVDLSREKFLQLHSEYNTLKEMADKLEAEVQSCKEHRSKLKLQIDELQSNFAKKSRPFESLLTAHDNNFNKIIDLWDEYSRMCSNLKAYRQELELSLKAHSAKSANELVDRLAKTEEKLEQTNKGLKQLEGDYPQFTTLNSLEQSQNHISELKQKQNSTEEHLHIELKKNAKLSALSNELQNSETIDVESGQRKLTVFQQKRQQLVEEIGALARQYQEVNNKARYFTASFSNQVSTMASEYVTLLTGSNEQEVIITDELNLRIVDKGKSLVPEQLSSGLLEQVMIAVHLAIQGTLIGNRNWPLIFDDAFSHSDDERLVYIYELLDSLTTERQILVFTHRNILPCNVDYTIAT